MRLRHEGGPCSAPAAVTVTAAIWCMSKQARTGPYSFIRLKKGRVIRETVKRNAEKKNNVIEKYRNK